MNEQAMEVFVCDNCERDGAGVVQSPMWSEVCCDCNLTMLAYEIDRINLTLLEYEIGRHNKATEGSE